MSEQKWLEHFANNLRYLMEEFGYSQRDLAEETNLSEAAISNYINMRRMPTIKAIVNISIALDVDYEELIDFGGKIY